MRADCLPSEQGAGIIAGGDSEAVRSWHLGNRHGAGEEGDRKMKVIKLDNVPFKQPEPAPSLPVRQGQLI